MAKKETALIELRDALIKSYNVHDAEVKSQRLKLQESEYLLELERKTIHELANQIMVSQIEESEEGT